METIGKYRIIRELGKGGFGCVYQAEDPTIGMTVAIKVLNVQDDEDMVRRFRAEAMTSAKLRHKNVVTVFDFDEANGVQYLVMEYLEGHNLQELIDQHVVIPPLEKLSIMAEVAEGLHYAHEQGVVHRDVKPANIMRLKDGSVKIMDFGIARVTQRNTRLTAVGYLVGTPQYMAPEQLMGGAADAQSDAWAFGVVLYEFLTGRNPFVGDTPGSTIYRITNEDVPPVSDCLPGLPSNLDPVVRRLLARRKEDRYRSLEDLRLDLSSVIQELGEAEVPAMERGADSLIRSGRYEEALTVAARILRFDQKNAKARKWRTELRDISRKQAEEARIKALIDQADAKTTQLDFSAAEAILREALHIDPSNTAARTKLDQIYAERNKKVRAKHLLAEAKIDLDRNALTSAFEHAAEAAATDPGSTEAIEFISKLRQAIESRDTEARRKAGLSKARGLLLLQDYTAAVDVLQELARQFPSDSEVKTRLEEALQLQSVEAAEKRVAAALARSREYLVKGAFQDAIDLLLGLETEAVRNVQVRQLLNYAREQLDQQGRDAEVERLLSEAAAPKGDYDKALALIARALEISPGNENALRLQKTVLANRQRDEEGRLLEAELLACRELVRADRLDEAQSRARALWTRHPEHAGVQQMVRDIGQRYREREEAIEREIQSGRRDVAALLDRGELESAAALLKSLTSRYQRENAFADLLRRARQLEGDRREREAVNAALARSQDLSAAGRWDDAKLAVEQALKQFPGSAPLQAERERLLRDTEVQMLVTDIQEKIARRELDSAVAAAESGIGRFPGDARLAAALQKARDQREYRELLLRAEAQILAGELEEAEKTVSDLSRLAPADGNLSRLLRLLDEKRQRRQNLSSADQLRRRFAFQQARDLLNGILRQDPEDAAAQALLDAVERESAEHSRSQKITAARTEGARLSKRKEYAAAVQLLTNIANEFPDDVDIQEDLRRARDSRDQSVRKEAYTLGCREFDGLMRARQFDEAIAKARELIAAFPGETDLQDDLRHATEARDQAVRREFFSQSRKELAALLKSRQFDQAIAKAEELIGVFPEEAELQDDLRRARVARDQAARKQAYAQGRAELDALLKDRQFALAVAKLEELATAFPDEPELQDELRRARAGREGAVRKDAYEQGRKEFEALIKSRNFSAAVAQAEKLIAAFPEEQELNDDLRRACEARDLAARKGAFVQGRKEFDALFKSRRFDEAVAKATALIAAFPDEPELQDDLTRASQAREQRARQETLARGRQTLENLMKDRQFDQAVAAAERMIANFPDEPEMQETLRRARQARDQAARKETYARSRQDLEELMRHRQFDAAVLAAERLAASFPEEPELPELLRRAREALDQAGRKSAYERGRKEIEGSMRNRRFDQAIAKAQELIASFPEESLFQDELKRAIEARDKAARQAEYDRRRQEFDVLMKGGQFAEAIAKAEALVHDFPGDPLAQQDLQAAKSARQVRERGAELEAQIAELEALFHKGDSDAVRKRAKAILQTYDDPRAKELLKWADRSQTELKAIKREAAPAKDKKRLLYLATPIAIVLIVFGLYQWLKPGPAGQLRVTPRELSFHYWIGDAPPGSQSFTVDGQTGGAWAITPSDPWFQPAPSAQRGKSAVSVAISPAGMGPGWYSGVATVTPKDGSAASPVTVRIKLRIEARPLAATTVPSTPEKSAPAKEVNQGRQAATPEKAPPTPNPKSQGSEPPVKTAPPAVAIPAVAPFNPPAQPAAAQQPPLEPAVDCQAASYGGLNHGVIQWLGALEPQQSVTIDRHNRVVSGVSGRVKGDHIPGCAVNIFSKDGSISVTEPGVSANFSTVTIRNTGNAPVNNPEFEWRLKSK